MQRAIDTGNADDVALLEGNTYEVGFEVHLWEYTTRDHYVSFPLTMSVGDDTGDIEAVQILGDGEFGAPNWDDFETFPSTRVYLFQPGINTWEFLVGANEADGKVYTDPVTGCRWIRFTVERVLSRTGHRVPSATSYALLMEANSMEAVAADRGGVWADTPVD